MIMTFALRKSATQVFKVWHCGTQSFMPADITVGVSRRGNAPMSGSTILGMQETAGLVTHPTSFRVQGLGTMIKTT